MSELPYTPTEQTGNSTSYFPVYGNPQYSESDEGLAEESTKNYTISFTPVFDQLVLSIYHNILSLPTTTPFAGDIPPSGLLSKVAVQTMGVMQNTSNTLYDHNNLIGLYGKSQTYYPIFLQLIRRRLLDLCSNNVLSETSIVINSSGLISNNRQTSISNLCLNELNINNYKGGSKDSKPEPFPRIGSRENVKEAFPRINSRDNIKGINSGEARNSLRKQSLTRNNSYSNSWLHIGNLANINHNHMSSTDSLQDFVPQNLVNRSAIPDDNLLNRSINQIDEDSNYYIPPPKPVSNRSNSINSINSIDSSNQRQNSLNYSDFSKPNSSYDNEYSRSNNPSNFNYQTPPSSHENQFKTPDNINNNHHHLNNNQDFDDFNFYQNFNQNQNKSVNLNTPQLSINTGQANVDALNSLNGIQYKDDSGSLDSPFMSATTEDSYFINGFPSNHSSPSKDDIVDKFNSGNYTLNEKKRDSLKMKRGIH